MPVFQPILARAVIPNSGPSQARQSCVGAAGWNSRRAGMVGMLQKKAVCGAQEWNNFRFDTLLNQDLMKAAFTNPSWIPPACSQSFQPAFPDINLGRKEKPRKLVALDAWHSPAAQVGAVGQLCSLWVSTTSHFADTSMFSKALPDFLWHLIPLPGHTPGSGPHQGFPGAAPAWRGRAGWSADCCPGSGPWPELCF